MGDMTQADAGEKPVVTAPLKVDFLSDIEDAEARAAARAVLDKNPKAKMFVFDWHGQTIVGRVITMDKMLRYGDLFQKKSQKAAHTIAAMVRDMCVFPSFPDTVFSDDTYLPGHLLKLIAALQVGNGLDNEQFEGEVKNLY